MNYDEYYKQLYAINLKINRIEAELNQTELAEILNVPQSMIARYESGKVLPEIGTMEKIARALNTRVGSFFNDDFIFNIKKTELGTKYEMINATYKSDNISLFGFDVPEMVEQLSEENKLIAIMFIKNLLQDQNRDENLKLKLENSKMELEEAKEAQKENKRLKKLQKIHDYKRINNLYDKDEYPYKEEILKYCDEQGITEAEYYEQHDKEEVDFAKKHGGRAAKFSKDENGNIVLTEK